jgi:hypothetical protein
MNDHAKIDIKNRQIFRQKPLIKEIYNDYFKIVKKNLTTIPNGLILEIGSSGFIKEIIPECKTSNLEKNDPLIDMEENVYSLNIKSNTISNLILIDIFHHIEFPKLALKKMHDVLLTGGRIIMIEPAMGILPRIIYKLFHHEPNGFDQKIKWDIVPDTAPNKNTYFAAQSIPWRAFIKKEINLGSDFEIRKVECFSDFAFLCSGGFSYKSFYPLKIHKFIKMIDIILTKISFRLFSARMLIVLEKK